MESAVQSLREEFGEQGVWVPPSHLLSPVCFLSLLPHMIVFHDRLLIFHTSGYESVPPLQGTKCDVRKGERVKDLVAFL